MFDVYSTVLYWECVIEISLQKLLVPFSGGDLISSRGLDMYCFDVRLKYNPSRIIFKCELNILILLI